MDMETQERLKQLEVAMLKLATNDLRQSQMLEQLEATMLKLAANDLRQSAETRAAELRHNQLIEEMRAEHQANIEHHGILLDQVLKSQLRLEELAELAFKMLRNHENRISVIESR